MKIRVDDPQQFKQKALQWASSFDVFCCLDSNDFIDKYSKFDFLLAVGVKTELAVQSSDAFDQLERFRVENPGWITGFLTYDLKNEVEKLQSCNPDHLSSPELYFFSPEHLIVIKDNEVEIISDMVNQVGETISSQESPGNNLQSSIGLKSRFSREEYIGAVDQIRQHIVRGDIYVTNFCQEFYAENAKINPLATFLELNRISPNPFSAFFRLKDKYILCASPERFLGKRGNKLISQPIKGTAKRYADPVQDELSKQQLHQHTKELQENVMIVDLVRNDLTKSARQSTVQTEELFGLFSFSQVHQMISTIVCEKSDDVNDVQAIRNTFPMGSMTGAPKISAMRLMDEYERTKRGVYSGAIGYFSPDGDFDFNVVIRTLLYNETEKYLSFQVGGAITFHADPEKEYEECLLKAQAILEALGQPGSFQNLSL
ncbi:MAG TPA: anthranilate synthase component I family protein [Mucilaginibacter sp.]|nr:anthranilate synthase component I family protein [Mucilaginibacter sp.]